MINAWIITREEEHISDKHWIFLDKDDALKVAEDIRDYWLNYYGVGLDEANTNLYAKCIFYCNIADVFTVSVEPIVIREKGETRQ